MGDLERYKIHRDYIKHEDANINYRITWLIAVQTISLAAFGLVLDSAIGRFGGIPVIPWILRLTALLGLTFACLSLMGVGAAAIAMGGVKKTYESGEEVSDVPPLTGGGRRLAAIFGTIYTYSVPFIFVVIWSVIGYHAWFNIDSIIVQTLD